MAASVMASEKTPEIELISVRGVNMTATKGAIIQFIESMDDASAGIVLDWLNKHFNDANGWDAIEEIEPDEIDLDMLKEIDDDPDCKVFISEDELISRRLSRKTG